MTSPEALIKKLREQTIIDSDWPDDLKFTVARYIRERDQAASELSRLTARVEELEAASVILSELVALIPLNETVKAAETGATLVAYFKSALTRAATLDGKDSELAEARQEIERGPDTWSPESARRIFGVGVHVWPDGKLQAKLEDTDPKGPLLADPAMTARQRALLAVEMLERSIPAMREAAEAIGE